MVDGEAELRAELITFQCKECYVYRPPPASSIGHRAELWDVDHWLQVNTPHRPVLRFFKLLDLVMGGAGSQFEGCHLRRRVHHQIV